MPFDREQIVVTQRRVALGTLALLAAMLPIASPLAQRPTPPAARTLPAGTSFTFNAPSPTPRRVASAKSVTFARWTLFRMYCYTSRARATHQVT
jgi:hypothetical protein